MGNETSLTNLTWLARSRAYRLHDRTRFQHKNSQPPGRPALSNHCQNRSALGKSRIDPARSHLNRRLHGGSGSVDEELAAWFKRTGSKKPAKQASTPYLTLVLGLSPSFYKADPANADRFNELAMQWLQEQFGDDLVLADLHLDETTPHIHAVVAPTYEKKKRLPGRRKKNETEEQFEARREAARNAPGDRVVGWSSSKYRYDGSFEDMRRSLVAKLAPLSVNYGTPGRRPREWKTWMNKLATSARKYGVRAKQVIGVMKGALDNFDELHGQMSADRDAMRRMVKTIEKEINRSSLRSKEKEDIRKVIDVTKEELRMIDNNIKKAERFTEKVDNYVETNARGMRM